MFRLDSARRPDAAAPHQNRLRAQQRRQVRLEAAAPRTPDFQWRAALGGQRPLRGAQQQPLPRRGEPPALRAQPLPGVCGPGRAPQENLRRQQRV